MRRKLITAFAAAAVLAGGVVAWGAVITTSMGEQPSVTPQLEIVSIRPFDADRPIPVRINYENFDLRPELRCSPAGPCTGSTPQVVVQGRDQGHVHVYFQRVTPGMPNVDSDSFCIPANVTQEDYSGFVTGNCPAVNQPGLYRMSAEFQSNSHVSALKAENKPQDVPTSDVKEVRAR